MASILPLGCAPTRHSLCKTKSHAFAEDALRFIDVEMSNEAEIIRIVSRRRDNKATGAI